jgi:hypothetical protein
MGLVSLDLIVGRYQAACGRGIRLANAWLLVVSGDLSELVSAIRF